MKCKYCGSNLTIDDERCPFCGKASPFAVKHRSEMKRFTSEFDETKAQVVEKSNRFNSWTVKITVIAILVALNAILLYMTSNSWQINKLLIQRDIAKHLTTYQNAMKEYEENQDFMGMADYFEKHNLIYSDYFNEYRQVESVCSYYRFFYQYLMECTTVDDNSYFTKEDRIEYMMDQLTYLYKAMEQNEYSDPDQFKPEHVACMEAAMNQTHALIKTYCGVTQEELDKFPTMSSARRQIAIERGMGLGE